MTCVLDYQSDCLIVTDLLHERDDARWELRVSSYRKLRMAPEGLNYLASRVDQKLTTCYQVMETADRALLDQWISHWSDIVEFEIHTVVTSRNAAERVTSLTGTSSSADDCKRGDRQLFARDRLWPNSLAGSQVIMLVLSPDIGSLIFNRHVHWVEGAR